MKLTSKHNRLGRYRFAVLVGLCIVGLLTLPPDAESANQGVFQARLVKDITVGPASSEITKMTVVGEALFFVLDDGEHGIELWKSDGTADGTTLVKDIFPGPEGSRPDHLLVVNDQLYFVASDGLSLANYRLWRSDGSREGTFALPASALGITEMMNIGELVYFVGSDGTTMVQLWRTDGTATGTRPVQNITPENDLNVSAALPANYTRVGESIYFSADDGMHGRELWYSDGTAAGTYMVKNMAPGRDSTRFGEAVDLGGTLVFSAWDGLQSTLGYELWRSDGTAAGTELIKDINPRGGGAGNWLTVIAGILYFVAFDNVHGSELWRTDGTTEGTWMVKDILPGSESSSPRELINIGDMLYFLANDGIHGQELWRSDGTSNGTHMVKDLRAGAASSNSFNLVNAAGALYMIANDGIIGPEVWRSDGTAAGTVRVSQIQPRSRNAFPRNLVAVGDKIFFTNNDSSTGRELWVLILEAASDSSNVSKVYLPLVRR